MVDFQMYDLAVRKTATNLMSYAKRHDNKIELKNFDPTNHTHMYIFEVARLVSKLVGKCLYLLSAWSSFPSSDSAASIIQIRL